MKHFVLMFALLAGVGCADVGGDDVALLNGDSEGVKVAEPQDGDVIVTAAAYPDEFERLKFAVRTSLDLTEAFHADGGDPEAQVEVWIELVQTISVNDVMVVQGSFGGQSIDAAISTLNAPDFQIGGTATDGEDGDVVGTVRYSDDGPWLSYRIDPVWL